MTPSEWAGALGMGAATIRLVVWYLDRRDARRHREELARIEASSGTWAARARASTDDPLSRSSSTSGEPF